MQRKIREQLPSLSLILFGVFLIILIPFQIGEDQMSVVGPRFFPYLLSILIIIFSTISYLSEMFKNGKETDDKEKSDNEDIEKPNYLFVFFTFIGIILWIVLVKYLGFIITSLLLMVGLMIFIGNKKPYQVIIIPVIFVLGIFYIFGTMLHIPLP